MDRLMQSVHVPSDADAGQSDLVRSIRSLREELNWYYNLIEKEQLRPEERSPERIQKLEQEARAHEDDLMRACTSQDSLLRARFADTSVAESDQLAMIKAQARLINASYDPRICKSVIATLARNHTWVTPTLVVYQPYAHAFDSATTHPEWAKYVPGIVQGGWVHRAGRIKPADSMVVRSYFSFDRTRELKEAGVKLLAGTDMPQAFVYPGFSLHQELELLVRSGLTPLEALRTAAAEATGHGRHGVTLPRGVPR